VQPAANDPFGSSVTAAYVKQLSDAKAPVEKIVKKSTAELAAELTEQAAMHSRQAALDAVLLLLNAAAFSGYAVFPITFFGPDETGLKAIFPLWPGNGTARYWGNFLGDFAWTIEPILVLIVPQLIKRPSTGKPKEE